MAQEGTPEQARGLLGPRGKLYQDLYESAPLAYLSVGLDGSIRTANRGAVELFGYSLDDLIGQSVLDLYADTPAGRSKANEMFQRFRSGENIRDEELEIRRADGQHRWISLSVRPVTDEDGRVLASRSIAVDVTARKQAQEALEKANQTLETIIQASPLAIIVLDPQGHVEMWNTAAERIFGWSEQEVIGHAVAIVPEGKREEFLSQREWIFRGEPLLGAETQRQSRSGFPVEVCIWGAPLYDADGQISACIALIADITERKRAEEIFRETEERFRTAFEESAIGMALQGLGGRYLRVNRALCEMLGYSAEDLMATTFQDLTHPDDRASDLTQNLRMIAGELGSYQTEKRYLHKLGHTVWALVSVSLVRSRDEHPLNFVVQAQDITERRRSEETQAKLQAQLAQSEKLATMGQLLAGVAHELNNPLSVVIGQASLLGAEVGGGPRGVRVEKIVKATERCGRIVKNFLALARQYPPERQQVDLNQVIVETVELLAYPLRADDVEVTLDLVSNLPPLWADPHQLQQVVVNLVSNAHQAMQRTSPPRQLAVTSRFDPERGRVLLEVADTGPGMPSEVQARIFEPFFTTKPPGQGTGLGLSLCQGVIEGHGGSITVESQPGQGAVFRVELPVGVRPAIEAQSRKIETVEPIQGKTILVVDDEPEIALMLAELLSADGHQVETAANGVIALDRIERRHYDLIVSDLKMPELDGLALYRELGCRHPDYTRRMIFLTGDVLDPEIHEFFERTGAPALMKPFALDEVRQVVQQVLRGRP